MRLLVLLLFAQICIAQTSGIVKDSKTKAIISYVNIGVENEDIGVSANEKGEFILPKLMENHTLIFSAVGYKPLLIKPKEILGDVFLEQIIFELKELSVKPKMGKNSLKLGGIDKKKIKNFSSNRGNPYIYARYFPFTKEIRETRYIKEIRFLTRSKIKNTIFNVRLLTLGNDGSPIEYYSEQNIIGECKKGKKTTIVNTESLNIKFPESGLLVGVEWLVIERNKFVFEYSEKGKEQKTKVTQYSPCFGNDNEIENFGWRYSKNSKWRKSSLWTNDPKNPKGSYNTLAVELILTD